MLGIDDKIAVVTGATQGLGKAMAFELAAHGAKLVLAARGEAGGARTVEELSATGASCIFQPTDVSRHDDVEALVDRAVDQYGRVDIMINNAGIFIGGSPTEMAVDDWNRVIDVNLSGVYYGARAAGRRMIEQGDGGRIVNVSSIIGVVGKLLCSAYTASKGAVNALTRNLAIDLARYGILVNAIVPGVCDSEINAHVAIDDRRRSEAKIPLGRWGSPAEIAKGVVFLCSDMATYVTGTTLIVDGGYVTGTETRSEDSIL